MNVFKFAFSRLLRRWVIPQAKEGHFFNYKINKEYVRHLAAHYAMLSALTVVHFFLCVGGIVLTLAALARSVDVDGVLHATALFWTGLGLTIYSLAVIALAARALRSVEIKTEELVVRQETQPSFVPRFLAQVVQPALEGVIMGLRSPRPPPRIVDPRPPTLLRPVDTGREERLAG